MDIMHLDSQYKDLYTKTVELYGEELTAEDLEPLALYASEYYALPRGESPTDADATRVYNDFADAYTGATTIEEIDDYYRDLLDITGRGSISTSPSGAVTWSYTIRPYKGAQGMYTYTEINKITHIITARQ